MDAATIHSAALATAHHSHQHGALGCLAMLCILLVLAVGPGMIAVVRGRQD